MQDCCFFFLCRVSVALLGSNILMEHHHSSVLVKNAGLSKITLILMDSNYFLSLKEEITQFVSVASQNSEILGHLKRRTRLDLIKPSITELLRSPSRIPEAFKTDLSLIFRNSFRQNLATIRVFMELWVVGVALVESQVGITLVPVSLFTTQALLKGLKQAY